MLHGLDGTRTAAELVRGAVAAGASAAEATGLLTELTAAQLVEDAGQAIPDGLAPDVERWRRQGRTGAEVLDLRAAASVEVHGSGRVAIMVAVLLAATGTGRVLPRTDGRVVPGDVGAVFDRLDVGQQRAVATAARIRRHQALGVRPDTGPVDLAVVADEAVHDVALATKLITERTAHLAVHVRDGRAVVGPLVLPGRTACLRCVNLHRSRDDPCWPRLAAQLAGRRSEASHTGTSVAAGIAVEQLLDLLTGTRTKAAVVDGDGEAVEAELDPLTGRLTKRTWPAHPQCGCGAAPRHPRGTPAGAAPAADGVPAAAALVPDGRPAGAASTRAGGGPVRTG